MSASFAVISNWATPRPDQIGLVIGSLMNPERYVFTTKQPAYLVVETLELYVKIIVEQRKAQAREKQEQEQLLKRAKARGARPF